MSNPEQKVFCAFIKCTLCLVGIHITRTRGLSTLVFLPGLYLRTTFVCGDHYLSPGFYL